jgi:hypothetical protein
MSASLELTRLIAKGGRKAEASQTISFRFESMPDGSFCVIEIETLASVAIWSGNRKVPITVGRLLGSTRDANWAETPRCSANPTKGPG